MPTDKMDGTAETFAGRMVGRRKELGLSQTNLAEALGFSSRRVSGYERGTREPDLKGVRAIAKCLRCSSDWLLGLDSTPLDIPAVPEWFRPLLGDVARICAQEHRRTLKTLIRNLAGKTKV